MNANGYSGGLKAIHNVEGPLDRYHHSVYEFWLCSFPGDGLRDEYVKQWHDIIYVSSEYHDHMLKINHTTRRTHISKYEVWIISY